jgi:Uma2 family endonuclease
MADTVNFPSPPRTPLEAFEMFPEGSRVELIDNAIYMPPAPSIEHQETSMSLSAKLFNYLSETGKGKVYASPIDVYLGDRKNAVQPDIVVILKENLPSLTADKRRITGVPDILIEILSEGNKDYDLEKKKGLYERFGVKEYFAIDPETGLSYHYFLNQHGHYDLTCQHIRKLESRMLGHTFIW